MLIDQLNAILPQTQCGLCGYAGCKPYAQALAEKKAPINLCPPGGIAGLSALGELCGVDPTPYIAEMEAKARTPQVAIIRESECIGCMKCIKACPVDAIVGTAKFMHTVIQDACTGCELCLPPCPVDCIDLSPTTSPPNDKREQYKKSYEARQQRLALENRQSTVISDKKSYLMQILERSKS